MVTPDEFSIQYNNHRETNTSFEEVERVHDDGI